MLIRPLGFGTWEERVRTRFRFLADLDDDERRWATCDERLRKEVEGRWPNCHWETDTASGRAFSGSSQMTIVVALGVRVQSSEERHAGRFLLALGETGTGGGDTGRRIHLVRAHSGAGIGVRCDHLDVAALFA